MAVAIRVPDLGTTVDEIRLVHWLVQEGQPVKRGDIIAEIETDKAVSELECAADGILLKQVVPADQTAKAGAVLAYVGQPGEAVPAEEEPAAAPPAASGAALESGAAGPAAGEAPVKVSAVVRNLAQKLGVDLGTVVGTGPGGVITREDVQRAGRAPAGGPEAGEALPRAQAAVARAVSTSHREIPHLYVSAEIDMTAAQGLRLARQQAGAKLSYDAIFLKALAEAIRQMPLLAARLSGDRVLRPQGIHIALAVGVDNDLWLPVVREVDRQDLDAIQAAIADLAARAKARTLRADELTGACMTLSNLGMYPIETFVPIIFPEHSSILALGAVRERPVAVAGRLEVRPTALATLAVDHRLVNGRTAAAFLTKVKEIVETLARET